LLEWSLNHTEWSSTICGLSTIFYNGDSDTV